MKNQRERIRVAISLGDPNGIGPELLLRHHHRISEMVDPVYIVDPDTLQKAAALLHCTVPENLELLTPESTPPTIRPGTIDAVAGAYSFASFKKAVELVTQQQADALCTLPIHKKAWELAGIPYKGHTDALRDFFGQEAIMMLGCPGLYVGLYTEHIPLKDIPDTLNEKRLFRFLLDFHRETGANRIAVLGLNPHAGDGGVLGNEEIVISRAIERAEEILRPTYRQKKLFYGPLVPDTAFIPSQRQKFTYYVALYHDQGLIPLKALYFDESINVSLNLPILRSSVDHGTAFDIAYRNLNPNPLSYLNAVSYLVDRLTQTQSR